MNENEINKSWAQPKPPGHISQNVPDEKPEPLRSDLYYPEGSIGAESLRLRLAWVELMDDIPETRKFLSKLQALHHALRIFIVLGALPFYVLVYARAMTQGHMGIAVGMVCFLVFYLLYAYFDILIRSVLDKPPLLNIVVTKIWNATRPPSNEKDKRGDN